MILSNFHLSLAAQNIISKYYDGIMRKISQNYPETTTEMIIDP